MKKLDIQLQRAREFVEGLRHRGLIYDSTDINHLVTLLASGKKVYLGIDPTADFLHLGHYVGFSLLKRFIKFGYPVVILIGSLTARIGDPSFRSKSRNFNPNIDHNTASIRCQIERLFAEELQPLDGGRVMCEIIDNYDFHNNLLLGSVDLQTRPLDVLLRFFSLVCSHIKVVELVSRDFLKDRLKQGLTMQECLYTCLQGWDFLSLYDKKQVSIQLGGQDQWGNMITGLTLISKVFSQEKNLEDGEEAAFEDDELYKSSVHAGVITFPLIVDGRGNKFGKSEGNAICISGGDESKNAYLVRQYFLSAPDGKVHEYLRIFTDFSLDDIEKMIMKDINVAKAKLADSVCGNIFGEELSSKTALVSKSVFDKGLIVNQSYDQLKSYAKLLPAKECQWVDNIDICSLFRLLDFVASRSEFNRLVKSRGIFVSHVNPEDLLDVNCVLKLENVIWKDEKKERGFVLIRRGQKQNGLIHIVRTQPSYD